MLRADGRRREVRRVLRRRPRRAAARRPRDDREHGAGVRRDLRLLPGGRGDARLPAPDRAQRGARRARRGVLQGERPLARRRRAARSTRRSSSSTSRPSSRRWPARAGRRTACRSGGEARRSSRRCRPSASSTATGRQGDGRAPGERPGGRGLAGHARRGGTAWTSRLSRSPHARDGEGRARRRDGRARHGAVVIAAITSCTNTSNPSVMVAAGLVAKKAVERGAARQAVGEDEPRAGLEGRHRLLRKAGLTPYLDALGFNTVGYGCTTCIGNSGPLPGRGLAGDRRRAGSSPARCSPATATSRGGSTPTCRRTTSPRRRSSSPMRSPGGWTSTSRPSRSDRTRDGADVFLADIWPSSAEVQETIAGAIGREMFREGYADVFTRRPRVARARDSLRGLSWGRLDLHPAAALLRGHSSAWRAAWMTSTGPAASSWSATR